MDKAIINAYTIKVQQAPKIAAMREEMWAKQSMICSPKPTSTGVKDAIVKLKTGRSISGDECCEEKRDMKGLNMKNQFERLHNEDSHTASHRLKFTGETISGDYIQEPIRAIRLIHSTPLSELNSSGKTQDFASHVHFRMQLRPNLN